MSSKNGIKLIYFGCMKERATKDCPLPSKMVAQTIDLMDRFDGSTCSHLGGVTVGRCALSGQSVCFMIGRLKEWLNGDVIGGRRCPAQPFN